MSAVVVVDVGNTSTSIGLCRAGRISRLRRLPRKDNTVMTRMRRVVEDCIGSHRVVGSVVASVVPTVTPVWQRVLASGGMDPIVVTHRTELGIGIAYPKPHTIGPDRLANACAAFHDFGAPVIVADFGTALTFDIVDVSATYVGGVIAPGLPMMTDYLAERTALLPHITLRGRCGPVGKSTEGAMRIGARVGYRGAVREIVAHLCESDSLKGAHLCATGGFASWALSGSGLDFKIDPHLTLRGLGRIFALNQ